MPPICHSDFHEPNAPPGPGWYPAAIEGDTILWQYLGDAEFSKPFFQDTLYQHRRLPVRSTPLTALQDMPDALPPSALIFHASRCGSTLLMQMLTCLSGVRAISEPPALDSLLARLLSTPGDDDLPLLRGLVAAFGQRQNGVRHLFIKHDSWHLAALPLMQRAFPGVPCWFLHRDPAEILRSHQKERGSQMVPGMVNLAAFGFETDHVPLWDLDARTTTVITSILRTASVHIQSGALRPLTWDSLPGSINTEWLATHGVFPDAESLIRMNERTLRHSKHPSQPWPPP